MSDSNWLNTFVSGIIFGGFLLFIAIQLYPTSIYSQSPEEKACSEQQKGDAFLRPFLMGDEEASLTGNQGGENTQNGPEPKYDYCDLVAQQRAAKAAQGSEWSSWLTTGLTGAGVLLLLWTLQATRQTLREAETATAAALAGTKAAEDTVAETRRIGEAQVRSYLSVDKVEFEWADDDTRDPPHRLRAIQTRWQNTGQSPARQVTIMSGVEVVELKKMGNPISKFSNCLKEISPGTVEIAAGGGAVGEKLIDSDDFGPRWIAEEIGLIVYSAVAYIDVFGTEHRIETCSSAHHFISAKGKSQIKFAAYPHHNSEEERG